MPARDIRALPMARQIADLKCATSSRISFFWNSCFITSLTLKLQFKLPSKIFIVDLPYYTQPYY